MAADSKYSPEVHEAICESVRKGATLKASAEANGIDYSTMTRWEKRYATFRKDLTRARANGQVLAAHVIGSAIQKGDVQAAFRYLALRDPENWADKQRLEVTGQDGGPLLVFFGEDTKGPG